MDSIEHWLRYAWLFPVGCLVGAFGTLIGAGGGFLLVPVLLFSYPSERPEIITSISLAAVFFNATSGSIAYARKRRIDFASGLTFAAAGLPGTVLGVWAIAYVPTKVFRAAFGAIMLAASVFLMVARPKGLASGSRESKKGTVMRVLVDGDGTKHVYAYRRATGIAISACVGFLSSMLGIGGGIVHVPAMVGILNFPVHLATATSHFVLAIMTFVGVLAHVAAGTFDRGVHRTLILAAGVVLGAQLGAHWSGRVRGVWILRGLTAAIGVVGLRLLIFSL